MRCFLESVSARDTACTAPGAYVQVQAVICTGSEFVMFWRIARACAETNRHSLRYIYTYIHIDVAQNPLYTVAGSQPSTKSDPVRDKEQTMYVRLKTNPETIVCLLFVYA
jgi:hypothetical protein